MCFHQSWLILQSGNSIILLVKKMTESNVLTQEKDHGFIPKFIPKNLKWYEKDGLETWYRQNKCEVRQTIILKIEKLSVSIL